VTQPAWFAFSPRDTVFVRDGRSFDAAADNSAQTVLPGPATLAGAVAAAFGAEPAEVRGPVLARRGMDGWEPYFPAPADLIVPAGQREPSVFRLLPEELPGQSDLSTADGNGGGGPARWLVPPEHTEPAEPLHGWLPAWALTEYLAGRLPATGGIPRRQLGVEEPLVPELRVGLARDGRTARAGFIYQAVHRRPQENWAFLAECLYQAEWKQHVDGPVKLGGRGRLADPESAVAGWPGHPDGSVGSKVLVYLATPALWPGGWRVPLPSGARLAAAAVGEPEPVATLTPGEKWRETRVLRWAVPAGSVYLLEFGDAGEGATWAREVHGTAYGPDPTQQRLRTAGFGVVLTGAWM
jgi:CRISPR-associated protein Cmr3